MTHFKMLEICTDILTQMNEDDEFKYFIENTDKDIFVEVKVENSQKHITNSYSLVTIKCQVHGLPFDTFTTVKNNVSIATQNSKSDDNPLYHGNILLNFDIFNFPIFAPFIYRLSLYIIKLFYINQFCNKNGFVTVNALTPISFK